MKWLITCVLVLICGYSASAQPMRMTVRDASREDRKLSSGLTRVVTEARSTGEDLRAHFIVGIMRVAAQNLTVEDVAELFNDPNAQVRMTIPSEDGSIVTFTSSIQGVLNAANREEVIAIQMSADLGGTSGMTVSN